MMTLVIKGRSLNNFNFRDGRYAAINRCSSSNIQTLKAVKNPLPQNHFVENRMEIEFTGYPLRLLMTDYSSMSFRLEPLST
jgi:hypothetical protein